MACGLLLAPFALWRDRKALLLVALLAILMGGVSSCTTSGVFSGGTVPGSGSGSGNTAAGTYPVVVTATSNGVQRQVTLTLIVD
jgi:zona occludens toxin (predicted ATPase)